MTPLEIKLEKNKKRNDSIGHPDSPCQILLQKLWKQYENTAKIEKIRCNSEKLWELLEKDPVLLKLITTKLDI